MICQDFLPAPSLRPFVRDYQLRHFIATDAASLPFKPYAPRPEQTLAFFPRGYECVEYVARHQLLVRPRSVVLGQHTERVNRHLIGPEFIVFLVNFQPGVLHRLVGIPFQELTNTFVDAETLFPKEIRRVNERLSSTDQYGDMITIVETFLLYIVQRINQNQHAIDRITQRLIAYPEDTSLLRLAEGSCLSPRQFERRFKERMGISPKLFTRIARLTKAFGMKYNHPNLDWLSIALYCGYHDYQHLSRDFKDLAGVSPIAYYEEDTQSPERHFGLQDSSFTGKMSSFYHQSI